MALLFVPDDGPAMKTETATRRTRKPAPTGKIATIPDGAEVSVVRERSNEQVQDAVRWLKAHMPGVAKPGRKTAQQILKEIRGA